MLTIGNLVSKISTIGIINNKQYRRSFFRRYYFLDQRLASARDTLRMQGASGVTKIYSITATFKIIKRWFECADF